MSGIGWLNGSVYDSVSHDRKGAVHAQQSWYTARSDEVPNSSSVV